VSADNHIQLTEDIFHDSFPARLRTAAPRVWFDGYWRLGFRDSAKAYPVGVDLDAAFARAVLNDGFEFPTRNQHLVTEGIEKEIVYPQSLLAFTAHPDRGMQQLIYSTYNEYIAAKASDRFYAVGVCANWWDPKKARSSIQQIVDLGLKSFMLPLNPGKDLDGNRIDYAGAATESLWAAAEEAGLPVSFHIGEVPSTVGRGGFGTYFIVMAAPFRQILGQMIFGGILDRHPALRIVFAEGGINWVAGALQDAELTYGAHREIYDWQPAHKPSYYWHNNCYATFQSDSVGLDMIDRIGADRVMWAQDYPHSEGTFGYTSNAVSEIISKVSEADARRILGDNARALYNL
jgi:predicted TIM-barrel fold metal-dependent hydrolase